MCVCQQQPPTSAQIRLPNAGLRRHVPGRAAARCALHSVTVWPAGCRMGAHLMVARQEHVRQRRAAPDVLQQLRHGVPACPGDVLSTASGRWRAPRRAHRADASVGMDPCDQAAAATTRSACSSARCEAAALAASAPVPRPRSNRAATQHSSSYHPCVATIMHGLRSSVTALVLTKASWFRVGQHGRGPGPRTSAAGRSATGARP
jgi:hypothetical protein